MQDRLTPEQETLYNVIYSCESREELMILLDCLDEKQLQMARSLLHLIALQKIDDMVDEMDYYPEAEWIINSIMRNLK